MIRITILILQLLTAATLSHASTQTTVTLKDAADRLFTIGAALNTEEFTEKDKSASDLVKRQFNTVSPENILKWKHLQPSRNVFTFELPDKFVEFGEKNNMEIIGHTLVWHNQTPKWVFQNDDGSTVSRKALLGRELPAPLRPRVPAQAGVPCSDKSPPGFAIR